MGGSVSKGESITDTFNRVVNETIIKNTSTCALSSITTQSIEFGKVIGDFDIYDTTLDSNTTINMKCLQDTSADVKLTNDIMKDLEAKVKATSTASPLSFVASRQEDYTKVINDVRNSFSVKDVKECLGNSITSQKIGAALVKDGVEIRRVTMSSTLKVVANCTQKNKQLAEALNKIETKLKSDASSLAGSEMVIFIVIVCCCILVVLGLWWYVRKYHSSEYNDAISNVIMMLKNKNKNNIKLLKDANIKTDSIENASTGEEMIDAVKSIEQVIQTMPPSSKKTSLLDPINSIVKDTREIEAEIYTLKLQEQVPQEEVPQEEVQEQIQEQIQEQDPPNRDSCKYQGPEAPTVQYILNNKVSITPQVKDILICEFNKVSTPSSRKEAIRDYFSSKNVQVYGINEF